VSTRVLPDPAPAPIKQGGAPVLNCLRLLVIEIANQILCATLYEIWIDRHSMLFSSIWLLLPMRRPFGDTTWQCSTYSHSIVAGGLDVTSRATRLMPRHSLVMRVEITESTS
jgi:hypothetical protein